MKLGKLKFYFVNEMYKQRCLDVFSFLDKLNNLISHGILVIFTNDFSKIIMRNVYEKVQN